MNTTTTSPTTGDPFALTTSPTNSPPLSATAKSHRPSDGAAVASGSGIGVAANRRASSSAGSGSATRARSSARSSSSSSSKSTRTEGSHSEPRSPRVVYGRGTIERLPTELGRLCASSPLIVSSPSRVALARRIQSLIPNLNSRILDSAVVNVPARVVDDAVSRIDDRDVVISVGGASAVGLAKAIGCRKGIPHVFIPTTYSGSEMMPLLLDAYPARHSNRGDIGTSSNGGSKSIGSRRREREQGSSSRHSNGARTTSFRDPRVLPSVIIYDEDLATSLPKRISAPTDEAAMARSTELRKEDETAQWSYIHLPGV
ncbi:Maleylacetate reductase 1 [Metarhizium anisopliae]|nr:Maleylacetate reductase 1 [Metarhizium anisopliae]